MKYFYLVLNWVFGVLFFLLGLVFLFISPLGAVFVFIISFLLIPPVRRAIFSITNISISRENRLVSILVLFITGIFFAGQAIDKHSAERELKNTEEQAKRIAQAQQDNIDYFISNKDEILSLAASALSDNKFEIVVNMASKYQSANDEDLNNIYDEAKSALDEIKRLEEEKRRLQMFDDLQAAISQERLSDALIIINSNSGVSDKRFLELKSEYDKKMTKYKNEAIERERQANYERRIRPYAIDEYTRSQYPSLVAQYRSRLPEIHRLRRLAAEQSVDSNKCDYVENVQLSQESRVSSLKFFIDCSNGARIYLTESEIKSGASIRTEAENAWDEGSAIISCRELIKREADIPSSVNFHTFTGTRASTNPSSGNVDVIIDFDAKNLFGTEIGFTARCIFPPKRQGEIEIFLRR